MLNVQAALHLLENNLEYNKESNDATLINSKENDDNRDIDTTIKLIERNLSTTRLGAPPVDLVIRTAGDW